VLFRSFRDDIHDLANHDLTDRMPVQCQINGNNDREKVYALHFINMRPRNEHASAVKMHFDVMEYIEKANEPINVTSIFQL